MTVAAGLLSRFNNPLASQQPRRMQRLYDIIGTVFQPARAGSNTAWGEIFLSTSRSIGKTIVGARFQLQKVGAPTGTVSCKIFDGGNNLAVILGTLDASLVALGEKSYEFTKGEYFLVPGQFARVVVEFTGGDASNHIDIKTIGADQYDGANTCLTWFDGVGWNASGAEDCGGSIYVI